MPDLQGNFVQYISIQVNKKCKVFMSLYIQPSKQKYDVAIVGSGAGGGMASKILSEAGLSVAVLEAGGFYDPAMEEYRTQLRWPWESPRRGASVDRKSVV